MRALLTAMDRWVRQGVRPRQRASTASRDGTLVGGCRHVPRDPRRGVAPAAPVRAARHYAFADPRAAVDADGNDRSGIRSAEQAVPVATFIGWNFRNPAVGAPKGTSLADGIVDSFRGNRRSQKAGRSSLLAGFAVRLEGNRTLTRERESMPTRSSRPVYLLAADVPQVIRRMEELWALARGREELNAGS